LNSNPEREFMARSMVVDGGKSREMIEEVELTPAEKDSETTADVILAAAGQSPEDVRWKCSVLRVEKHTGQEVGLFIVTPEELETLPERLRAEKGSGHYRVRAYRKQGSDRQVQWKAYDLRIEADEKPIQMNAPPSEMGAVLAAFDKLNSRMEAMFLRQLQPATPAAAVSDPINAVTQIVAAMKGLNDMMGPKTDPATTMGAAILQGIEIANKARGEVSGEGGGETSWMDLIREFLKNGGVEIMSRQQPMNGVKQQIPQKVAPPFPAPLPTPTPPAPQPMKPNEQQVLANARQGIMSLIPLAARGSDPRLYAEVVLDSWPREVIVSVLQQPNPIQLMQQLVPESVPYVPWFQKLIAEIKEMMNDGGASESASDASPDLSPVQPIGDTGWVGGSESDT
jgi:hypothetical protein